MLINVRPTFLYPTERKFPFDDVCEAIVRELEKRNWQVPGIKVELDTYGSGYQKLQLVRNITGDNFKLWFSRVQKTLPGNQWNDTAGIHSIFIPGKELSVFADESGPTLNVYVGNSWEKDCEWFMNSSKVNTKLHNEPRRHLSYTGSINLHSRSYYKGLRPPYLIANNDLGREYDPIGDEPKYYKTAEIMEEFRQWLLENVLDFIIDYPESKVKIVEIPKLTPFPSKKIGPFYTFIESECAKRIEKGQNNPTKLLDHERYAHSGSGYRVVPLGLSNDGTFPEIAYDGFLWCLPGEVKPNTNIETLPKYIGPNYRWDANYVISIKPKFAEGIYVVDLQKQENYKQDLVKKYPNIQKLNDEQYAEYLRILSRTIVPVTEYNGGYLQPIILINRELDFDEVELIIKPK